MHNFVIPVKTGIQCFKIVIRYWIPDPRSKSGTVGNDKLLGTRLYG